MGERVEAGQAATGADGAPLTYAEIARQARGSMGPWCKACPVCDGRACGAHLPGPGAKGSGTAAIRNHEAWQELPLAMDTIYQPVSPEGPSCSTELFGHSLSLPVMVGPVGDVRRHYGDKMDDLSYNACTLRAASRAGTLAWTGDGLRPEVVEDAAKLIAELGGRGIPTIKPWSMDVVAQKLDLVLAARPFAVAMDVDAAGLPFLKGQEPPAGPKSAGQLREIAGRCHEAGVPFIIKGVLTVKGAEKARDAGADGIVVSNHGGRVLDGVPATARMLPAIADAVGSDLAVLVDGGIRSGIDVFRALALGADAVLMCRPFVVCAYGAGEAGVRAFLGQLAGELSDAMMMCGASTVADIGRDMLAL